MTPIYFDDFSDPGSGWLISDHAKYAMGYANGNYRIEVREPNLLIRSPCDRAFGDCTIQVEAWRDEGANSAYGILFGVSADRLRHYLFRIQPARKEYALHRIDESTWVTLIPWTVSPMVNTYNGRNTLLVRRHGSLIELYVNGELLDSYVDGTYTGTRGVGLAAVSGSTSPVSLRYDNFTVWGADYTPAQVMMGADAAIAVPVPSGVDP